MASEGAHHNRGLLREGWLMHLWHGESNSSATPKGRYAPVTLNPTRYTSILLTMDKGAFAMEPLRDGLVDQRPLRHFLLPSLRV